IADLLLETRRVSVRDLKNERCWRGFKQGIWCCSSSANTQGCLRCHLLRCLPLLAAGQSVFAILKTPLFGREEAAADQFSTYIMLQLEKDEARRLISGGAYQYKADLSSPAVTVTQQTFAGEHGTPAQRFFNLLCVAYGADPRLFSDVVEKGFLPEDRAVGCKREYVQLSYAFKTLIGPHIDKGVARKLHKGWLPPVNTQLKTWRGGLGPPATP